MKQILLYILFSFFIINSDAQVLKDFRITKCYYDSTDLYFEYEFTPLIDISVQKQKVFHPAWLEDMEGISLIAEKFDSTLKKFATIPFLDHVNYLVDTNGNSILKYAELGKNKTYKNIASMHMFQFLRRGDYEIGGCYRFKLVQKIVNEEMQNSEPFFITLPTYDYKTLFKFNKK